MSLAVLENTQTSIVLPRKQTGEKVVYYPESDGQPMAETAYHLKCLTTIYQLLETYFLNFADTVVIADMMFYYEEGNPYKSISPDVMVVKGVGKHPRRVFKLWEENVPEVVFEISSRKTWRDDLQKKFFLYQQFGVKEYYIFDPEYDYLTDEPLVAFHLKNGEFKPVKVKKGRVFSPALQLEIVDNGERLRLFNPETKSYLLTNEELSVKLSDADNEIEKLKVELAKLKAKK
jgi:Uma2 family endonuclease